MRLFVGTAADMSTAVRLLILVLAVAAAVASGPVRAQEQELPTPAQEPSAPELTAEALIEAARAALTAGEVDHAALLLEGVRPGEGDIDDLDFLHGSIAMARGEWQEAIGRFRAMLARDPTLLRVRLDLALAYFQAGEDGSAAYHFRQVLGAEDLPLAVRANTLAFLDRIRRRKSWSVTGSVALAPDTNINAATSARKIDLFGLPATLSEDARQTSGVGLSASVGGGYEARLGEDMRFRTSASVDTLTFGSGRSAFNEQTLSLRAGPRFLFERLDLRPELTARGRMLGGETYSRAGGLELSGNWLMGPAWRLSASAGAERISYESFLGEGNIYAATLGAAHAYGQTTLLRATAGWRREVLDQDAYSWREYIAGVSVQQELPLGFVVTAGPSYRQREYGAPLPVYGPEARRDETVAGRITVSNRRIEVLGFMPEITVRHEVRESNLELYDYERTVGELGVVRTF